MPGGEGVVGSNREREGCWETYVIKVINCFQHPCCSIASPPPTRLFLTEPHSQASRPLMHLVLLLQLQFPKEATRYELCGSGQSLAPQEARLGQQKNVLWDAAGVAQGQGYWEPNTILHDFYKEEILLSHEIKYGQDDLTYCSYNLHIECQFYHCSFFLLSFLPLH